MAVYLILKLINKRQSLKYLEKKSILRHKREKGKKGGIGNPLKRDEKITVIQLKGWFCLWCLEARNSWPSMITCKR